MRIIGGALRGKRLLAPKNLPVRPTTDFAKEALFNILQNRYSFETLSALDLFSGTGNISFEFASRGAKHITAIDKNYNCVKFIQQTSESLKFNINVVCSDVLKYLENTNQRFDIIFADPPYDTDIAVFHQIHHKIFDKNILAPGGMFIMEHGKNTILNELTNFVMRRKYGNVNFSLFYEQ